MFHQRLGTAPTLCLTSCLTRGLTRCLTHSLTLVLAFLLAACGPGVGGTGTGNGSPEPGAAGLGYFGATPQSACAAPFASLLSCNAIGVGGAPVLDVQRVFTSECAVATFEGDAVTLDALCNGWVFSGRWGVDAVGQSRYYGLVGADPLLPPSMPAMLEVQAQESGLVVVLRAAEGELLAGPLVLQPAVPGP